MGKVMVSNFRHVTKEDDKDFAVRHVLRPGDDPKDLPKEVRQDLEKRGLIKDERQFDKATGVVLPPELALARYEESEQEKVADDLVDPDQAVRAPTSSVAGANAEAKQKQEAEAKEEKKSDSKSGNK